MRISDCSSDVCSSGLIHQAAPGLVPAARSGASCPLTLAEYDPETGRQKVIVVQHMVGSTGGRQGHDGIHARDTSLANLANNPRSDERRGGKECVRTCGSWWSPYP